MCCASCIASWIRFVFRFSVGGPYYNINPMSLTSIFDVMLDVVANAHEPRQEGQQTTAPHEHIHKTPNTSHHHIQPTAVPCARRAERTAIRDILLAYAFV